MLDKKPGVVRGRVIHFAPEPAIRDLVRPHASQYQSADLFMRGCDLALNLEDLDLDDESVDVFIASHVLEHVDDAKALSELHRSLKPGGVAIIMVPIIEGWSQTYENAAIQSDAERTLHFGQFDHVRYYGSDLRDRIRAAGFDLEEFSGSPEDCIKFGLMPGEIIFLAQRRS
jgi:SAM-dependent methyltransferase